MTKFALCQSEAFFFLEWYIFQNGTQCQSETCFRMAHISERHATRVFVTWGGWLYIHYVSFLWCCGGGASLVVYRECKIRNRSNQHVKVIAMNRMAGLIFVTKTNIQ